MGTSLHKGPGREFRISSFEFPVSSFEFRHANPNKPKRLKTFPINNIARKRAKQPKRAIFRFISVL